MIMTRWSARARASVQVISVRMDAGARWLVRSCDARLGIPSCSLPRAAATHAATCDVRTTIPKNIHCVAVSADLLLDGVSRADSTRDRGAGGQRTGMAAALPRTLGELQLYRILQRANLLCYYSAFIQQGGDDVQQLCEAGEEEFLEIMALVGMASKPLHVRRLQKALRDWVTNPALFNQPIASLPVCSIPVYKLPERSPAAQDPLARAGSAGEPGAGSSGSAQGVAPRRAARTCPSGPGPTASPACPPTRACPPARAWRRWTAPPCRPTREGAAQGQQEAGQDDRAHLRHGGGGPRWEEEVRKYSAIYGRFDSKRKDGKQLTLHELTVNEAAAQLCMRDLALLTRRDELFSLARQVSREVTYKYTYRTSRSRCGDRDEPSPKRIKTEEGFFDLQEALQAIHMRQETLREQLAHAKSTGEETLGRSLQVQTVGLIHTLEQCLNRMQTVGLIHTLEQRLNTAEQGSSTH
ncbi:hypothetical protein AAFF_G00208930 [Aldrovandia affinis]|uniref:Uncharacterized protein n=1 Tax=Aldrovandia affinis TaxID=143900 RepID=A0AAD7W540_9TELE|nr:hypothetical protein AAFF_G00208930 [Aldrovandia affinis]